MAQFDFKTFFLDRSVYVICTRKNICLMSKELSIVSVLFLQTEVSLVVRA